MGVDLSPLRGKKEMVKDKVFVLLDVQDQDLGKGCHHE